MNISSTRPSDEEVQQEWRVVLAQHGNHNSDQELLEMLAARTRMETTELADIVGPWMRQLG